MSAATGRASRGNARSPDQMPASIIIGQTIELRPKVAKCHIAKMPCRIGEPQGIVDDVAVAIEGLGVIGLRHDAVGGHELADAGIVEPRIEVDQAGGGHLFLVGVAAGGGGGDAAAGRIAAVGIALLAPGVITQPLHHIAALVDCGIQRTRSRSGGLHTGAEHLVVIGSNGISRCVCDGHRTTKKRTEESTGRCILRDLLEAPIGANTISCCNSFSGSRHLFDVRAGGSDIRPGKTRYRPEFPRTEETITLSLACDPPVAAPASLRTPPWVWSC